MLYKLLIFTLLIGCTAKQKSENILRVSLKSPLSHIDPARIYDHVHNQVGYQVYESLLEYDINSKSNSLKPLLASEMPTWSRNNFRVTFKIKPNVFYHAHSYLDEKRVLKAEDFITQIKRVAFSSTQSPGLWMIEGKILGLDEFRSKTKTLDDLFKNSISGLKAIDDLTLQIDLTRPDKSILYFFSMLFSSPIPKEFLKANGNEVLNQEVGTGPYELFRWRPKSQIKLSRFSKYHEELNLVNEIYFYIMEESQTRWLNFKKGKLDFIEIPHEALLEVVSKSGELQESFKKNNFSLTGTQSLSYWWLSFNMDHPVWGKNKLLRKAICHSIDRKKYNKLFTKGKGETANHILPPGVVGFEKEEDWCDYDLAQAKKLLSQSGYENGVGLPEIILDTRNNSTEYRQKAEFIKLELGKIGIKVKVTLNNFAEFIKKSKRGEMSFWQDGWIMDYPSAENTLQLLTSWSRYPGPNKSGFFSKRIDQIYDEVVVSSTADEKKALVKEFNSIIKEEVPWIMMSYSKNLIISWPRVKNLHYSELINNFYKHIEIK